MNHKERTKQVAQRAATQDGFSIKGKALAAREGAMIEAQWQQAHSQAAIADALEDIAVLLADTAEVYELRTK